MFVANALAVAIAKGPQFPGPEHKQTQESMHAKWRRHRRSHRNETRPDDSTTQPASRDKTVPSSTRAKPVLALASKVATKRKHKGLDDNADKRRNPASGHVHPPSAEQLAGDLRAAICACRSGWILRSHATMSERAEPSRRICVKCYDSRATDTPNRQRKTPLEGHSPLQSYFFMPVCAFRSDEKKRRRTPSSISDRFYDGNSLVDLLNKNVCLRSSFRVADGRRGGRSNTFQAAFEQKTTAPHATNYLLRHCARALRKCVTVTER